MQPKILWCLCISWLPSFIGDPQGPTFTLQKPKSATAYTYFSLLLDNDLLKYIADQQICELDCIPLQVTYQLFDTNVDENLGHFWGSDAWILYMHT